MVWNVVTGCTKVSAGCKNCYAEGIANRFWTNQIFEEKLPTGSLLRRGRKFTDVQLHEDRLEQPLRWKKPRMIFVNSMSDLFHEDVPFEFIEKTWDVMFDTEQHTYQILTKRPERMLEFTTWMREKRLRETAYKNIWLGVSVEDQKTADERIPILLETPAAVRWISAEPLLAPIDLTFIEVDKKEHGGFNALYDGGKDSWGRLDWVVCGGESGSKKRPFNCNWARSLRDQCKAANVPFFMKQVDKVRPIPEDLQIREYPK